MASSFRQESRGGITREKDERCRPHLCIFFDRSMIDGRLSKKKRARVHGECATILTDAELNCSIACLSLQSDPKEFLAPWRPQLAPSTQMWSTWTPSGTCKTLPCRFLPRPVERIEVPLSWILLMAIPMDGAWMNLLTSLREIVKSPYKVVIVVVVAFF